MTSKILITTSSFAEQALELLEALKGAGLEAVLNPYRRKLAEAEVDALIQEHRPVGMIAGVEPLTRTVLEKAPFLKAVSRCGIGMDSVDLDAARDLGIAVTNTPDAPTIPVAELAVGMMLALSRSIHLSDASIRSGGWERPMGGLLNQKTVGIVGCGRIGSYVAGILGAFGCRLVGYDPYLKEHRSIDLTSLERLLAESDIVTLHLPYCEENHHLIDEARLASMKKGALLVNAARGGLVDETALALALDSGRLGGAALDCFENEPYAGPLAVAKNTLLTGHIGSYAREGRAIMERQAAENLVNSLRDLELAD